MKAHMIRIHTAFLIALVAAAAGLYGRVLLATPANPPLFTTAQTIKATFGELNLDTHTIPADLWHLIFRTKNLSDLYVVSNVWRPGGTTGWHTHPGPSLIIVTSGTITAYESDDPTCSPHVYSQGMSFVDPGNGHVHVLRDEDPTLNATTTAVQFVPAGASRRIDAPDIPAACPTTIF
jgi:hypothetical protein